MPEHTNEHEPEITRAILSAGLLWGKQINMDIEMDQNFR